MRSQQPTRSNVQRAVFGGGESGFFDGFRERGVRVAHARNVFSACPELHGHHSLCDHVGSPRTAHVHPEDFIGVRMGEHLDQPVRVHARARSGRWL